MNSTVEKMIQFKLNGNIIDHSWYDTLTRENGKPYIEAIIILGEIVYWYRPTIIRDEATGAIAGYKQKFEADLLQRSYQSFMDKLGFGKDQTRNAINYLEERGVIKKEFRTIKVKKTGVILYNVLFIDLLFEGLQAITPIPEQIPIGFETDTPLLENTHLPAEKPIPPLAKTDTYTENSIENTIKTILDIEEVPLFPDLFAVFMEKLGDFRKRTSKVKKPLDQGVQCQAWNSEVKRFSEAPYADNGVGEKIVSQAITTYFRYVSGLVKWQAGYWSAFAKNLDWAEENYQKAIPKEIKPEEYTGFAKEK